MANTEKVLQFGSRAKKGLLSEAEKSTRKAFEACKLGLADRIRHDARLTPAARNVGAELASLSNFENGYAWAGQDYLAEKLGIDSSTVKRAVNQLEKAGCFCVHSLGRRTVVGGNKLIYYPIFEPELENDRGRFALCRDTHKGQKRRRHRAKEASDTGQNVPPTSLVIASSTSAAAPGAGGAAPDGAAGPEFDLGVPWVLLRKQLGDDVFKSWIGKLEFVAIDDGELTLSAPTSHAADTIKERFEQIIIACWRAERGDVDRLRITVVEPSASTPISKPNVGGDKRWLAEVGIGLVADRLHATMAAADKTVVDWLRRCGGDASSLRAILEAAANNLAGDQLRDFVKQRTRALLRADQKSLPLASAPNLVSTPTVRED